MNAFTELSLVLVIATLIACIMRLLRQPLILGHILTGLLIGPYILNLIVSAEILRIFSELGVALLLFIVGLQLSPYVIKEVGKIAAVTGVGQVLFTTAIGFFLTSFVFHYSLITSLYISIALTFSSTIIILKLLSDKGDLQKLYGKISIGFLLVQDIIAILILIAVSSLKINVGISESITGIIARGIMLTGALVAVGKYVLPRLATFFARSQELLFLFSISFGLGMAALFNFAGFSLEIGALIAGVVLSVSPYSYQISAKMRPLRDFFIVIFFILLGSQMSLGDVGPMILPALVLSFFVLLGNPLIVMVLMGMLGYNRKTGFFAGLTVAQISEFSLILVTLGVDRGHLSGAVASLITLVGLVTIAGSTYMIMYAEDIYKRIAPILTVFERKKIRERAIPQQSFDSILFGYNRIGHDILDSFNNLESQSLVVDFDPLVIKQLKEKKIQCLYGDADDEEFLKSLPLRECKMIVSTIPDYESNLLITSEARAYNNSAIIIVISHNLRDAELLYGAGATYVIMPHFLGGEYASLMIKRHGFSSGKFNKEREKHLAYLEMRKSLGHNHPVYEQT